MAESRQFVADALWLSLFPELPIIASLLCINLTGDALRDYYDPHRARLSRNAAPYAAAAFQFRLIVLARLHLWTSVGPS